MPLTDPECLGAKSNTLTTIPKWWKVLLNKANVQKNTASGKFCTWPKKTKINVYYIPGIAPKAFIMPKTDPECFGAKSCGLTITAALWKPAEKRHNVIKNKTIGNDEFFKSPEIPWFFFSV